MSSFIDGLLGKNKAAEINLSDSVGAEKGIDTSKTSDSDVSNSDNSLQDFTQKPLQGLGGKSSVDGLLDSFSGISSDDSTIEGLDAVDKTKHGILRVLTRPVLQEKNFKISDKESKKSQKPPKKKKVLKSDKGVVSKVKLWIAVAISSLILFALTLTTFLMGWDEKLLSVDFEGFVTGPDGSIIAGASITVLEDTVKTGDDGKFNFYNMSQGEYEVKLSADGYISRVEDVKIGWFSTTEQNFKLELDDYASFNGQLQFEGDSIDVSKLKLTIGDNDISIDENGFFEIDSIDLGEVEIVLESSFYKDFSTKYLIKPGQNTLNTITLREIEAVTILVLDAITEQPLSGVSLTLNDDNFVSGGDGVIDFGTITIEDDVDMILQRDGYNELDIKFSKGTTDVVKIVPSGIVYYTTADGISKSNYDGSDSLVITSDYDSVLEIVELSDKVLFVSEDGDIIEQVYSYQKSSGDITKISNFSVLDQDDEGRDLKREILLDREKVLLLHTPNDSSTSTRIRLEIMNIDGSDVKVLYNSRPEEGRRVEVKFPVISQISDKVVYIISQYNSSTNTYIEGKVMYTDFDRTNQLYVHTTTNESFELLGIPNNKVAIAVIDKEIVELNLSDKKTNVTNVGATVDLDSVSFVDNYMYFTAAEDLYRYSIDTRVVDKILENINGFLLKDNYIIFEQDQELRIVSLDFTSNVGIIGVETSFKMW